MVSISESCKGLNLNLAGNSLMAPYSPGPGGVYFMLLLEDDDEAGLLDVEALKEEGNLPVGDIG